MNDYTFATLNDKEFEEIVRDLLSLKLGVQLQTFKSGKDKGVDLRYSSPKNNNSLVVQVKHYSGSSFAQLKHTLGKKELPKVRAFSPQQYIVATSLALSAVEKDEIKGIFDPYILTSNDVVGKDDLNQLLADHRDIERRYFKLWFSSINVFQSIINNAIEGRTKFMLEKIGTKVPLYVITKKLDEANKILITQKILLITGQPGIGKTTLAEILIFDKARDGYKVYKVENVTEAENVFSPDDEEKQLFYFDDFLGSNYLEIINAQRTETQLTAFADRIVQTPNKLLVLTTRTVILNHAIEKYEKISRSKLGHEQFEIKLKDYSPYEKAMILYNHLYFNKVKDELYDSILEEKFYKTIISHKSYTPRIVQFITDNSKIKYFDAPTYHQFILNNLINPKEIWRYSYNNQIGHLDRCLLLTLFTFENSTPEDMLIRAFEERLAYEKREHNQVISAGQFHESIKILLNGFIASESLGVEPPIRQFKFINPSLTDFFIAHVSESYPERKSIVSSLVYTSQLDRFNPEKGQLPLEKELQIIIREKIASSHLKIVNATGKPFSKNKIQAIILQLLCRYCRDVNTDSLMVVSLEEYIA